MGSPDTGSPKKKMRRAKIPYLSPDRPHVAGQHTGNEAMMELLLDVSSRMHAMKEYVAQHEQADCKHALTNEAVRMSSPRLALPTAWGEARS